MEHPILQVSRCGSGDVRYTLVTSLSEFPVPGQLGLYRVEVEDDEGECQQVEVAVWDPKYVKIRLDFFLKKRTSMASFELSFTSN